MKSSNVAGNNTLIKELVDMDQVSGSLHSFAKGGLLKVRHDSRNTIEVVIL